ncbi:AsmA family protein [Thiobacter aerophilum]|uniref:AsmA family protein n=1 Tax=Thiobacter aerophilum TaxID=3121275 RepID=A0ABV0ECE2_9BURK
MPKRFKYALVFLGGLIVLFLAALALIAFTVDPNAFKPQIVKLVQEKKQRTLHIEGDVKLKLFPKLGIDLGKTRLSEHQGAGEFAALNSVRLYVAWLPLIKRELVVDKIVVEGARVHLVRNEDGTTNFDDLLSKETSQQVKFDIEGVQVSHSALSFDDRMAHRKWAISDLDVETGRIRDDTHSSIKADFKLTADNPKLAMRVDLKSGIKFALQDKHYMLDGLDLKVTGSAAGISGLELGARGDVDLRAPTQARPWEIALEGFKLTLRGKRVADTLDIALDAPRLLVTQDKAQASKLSLDAKIEQPKGTLSARLTLPDVSGSAKQFQVSQLMLEVDGRQGDSAIKGRLASPLTGSLDGQTFELAKLAANLDVANPKLAKGGIKLALAGSASLDLARKQAGASLTTQLDDSSIKAKLAVSRFDPPRLDFDIAIDQLDVDRYLPARAKTSSQEPESPIDLSALNAFDASGSIRIGSLKLANVKASNVRLDVRAGGGRVEVSPLSANLYQGTVKGTISATTTAHPRIAVQQNLSDISIGPLLRDLADKDLLQGRGTVALNVTTQGQTMSAMKKALDGMASVRLTDGAIKGVNIAALLRRAQSAFSGGVHTQSASATEQTDFSEMRASFQIHKGIAHNDDLTLKSPLLRVLGSGDIDLGAGSLDYLAKVAVVGTLEGQGGRELGQLKGVTVPLRVRGPFDALQYSLDTRSLVTESAKAKVEEKTQAIKEKAREELLKGLFGR